MLDPILASTRARIDALPPLTELKARCADLPSPRPFTEALVGGPLAVIAEIKRRSPSRGDLALDIDPVKRALSYEQGGAAAVSVLTEPHHFLGSNVDLAQVRDAIALPVLRKDFTLDPAQVWEARSIGADAVLLIVGVLDDATLRNLSETAADAGLDVLVEVHSRAEAERALEIQPRLVGVNNRDLATFEIDLATAENMSQLLAGVPVTVAESGVFGPDDAKRMSAAGYDAVLVGESLVRSGDPRAAIEALRVQ